MQESRSGSFVNFEVRDNFQHFRSESYVQALQTMSVSSPSFGETRFGDNLKVAPVIYRSSSNDEGTGGNSTGFSSAPSSPKRSGRGAQKSSTLPNHAIREIGFPKPKKSSSLSIGSFFRKLSPRSKRSKDKKGDKPWIVVEFSQSEIDSLEKEDSSGGSSQSIELAAKSKESYIRSLLTKGGSTSDGQTLSSRKAIARSANDIASGKTPISNLVSDPSASVSFSSVANTPVRKNISTELSPRKSLQDLKVKDGKRSSLVVFDPDSISNRTINTFASIKTTKVKKEAEITLDISSSEESDKAESQACLKDYNKDKLRTSINSSLKIGGKITDLPSVCVTKVTHHFNESRSAKRSLENVSRAQPPRTLNLATSFVDVNCVKKMNSTESIGVCSLDADSTTHSDGSLSPSNDHHAIADNYTSSAYTLKSTSLILSNGSSSPLRRSLGNPELQIESFGDVTDRVATTAENEESTPDKQISPPMKGKVDSTTNELDPGHLPSYLGISCAISGYSGYSRYCHSRDNSPARVSSVTPSKLSIATSKSPRESREIDPTFHEMSLLMNGNKPRSKTDSYICNKYFGGDSKTSLESETNYISSQNITLRKNSPVSLSNISTRKTSPIGPQRFYSNGVNGHHAGEPREENNDVGLNLSSDVRGSPFTDGPKSLVQQRIESLFGQPASRVVQGGAIRVSRPKSRTPVDANSSLRSPSCPPQSFRPSSRAFINAGVPGSPPVFRHITQDFKEQLRNATVPTKLSPVKPQLSPNKRLASLTISTTKDITKPLTQKTSSTNGYGPASKKQQPQRAASEPKTAFPTALSILSPSIKDIEPEIEIPVIEKLNQIGNGHYFIDKIDSATADIRRQIKEAEEDSKISGIPEEALGKLLSAAGKANLLIDQKFAQFRELCEKNISPDPSEPFPTTDEDLAGFWDMVLLQVDDVNATFSNLKKLKEQDWKEETVPYSRSKSQTKTQPKRNIRASSSKSNPTTPVHNAKASEKAKAREEQRKKLLEAKKRGRQQNPSEVAEIAIFTPDQAN